MAAAEAADSKYKKLMPCQTSLASLHLSPSANLPPRSRCWAVTPGLALRTLPGLRPRPPRRGDTGTRCPISHYPTNEMIQSGKLETKKQQLAEISPIILPWLMVVGCRVDTFCREPWSCSCSFVTSICMSFVVVSWFVALNYLWKNCNLSHFMVEKVTW